MKPMEIFTKADWQDLFEKCGLRTGSRVIFEYGWADVKTAGGMVTILEALMDTVSEKGAIIIPAYTTDAIDPDCEAAGFCDFEQLQAYRRSLSGFDKVFSGGPDGALTLLRLGGQRTEHPYLPYVYWGSVPETWEKQPLDLPQCHVLELFEPGISCDLLIGKEAKDSILYSAMAHAAKFDIAYVQKGYLHRPKRSLAKTYLMSRPDPEHEEQIMEMIRVARPDTVIGEVSALTLFNSWQKTVQIFEENDE